MFSSFKNTGNTLSSRAGLMSLKRDANISAFLLPQGRMQSRQLAIYIRRLHGIGIDYRHPPHSGTAYHLGRISTYTTQSYDKYMCPAQAFHFFIS